MNNTKKLAAAKKTYQLDNDGNLWTTPKGSRPITQDAVLVVVDGLAYRVPTSDIVASLKPKTKKKPAEATK